MASMFLKITDASGIILRFQLKGVQKRRVEQFVNPHHQVIS